MTQPISHPPLATLVLPEFSQIVSEFYVIGTTPDSQQLMLIHTETGQTLEGILEPLLHTRGQLLTLFTDAQQLPGGRWHVYPVDQLKQRIAVSIRPDYQGQDSLEITTPTATYLYHLQGAGFASILDHDGHDWLSYYPRGGSDGRYRGIPNLVYPEGHFHPGGTACKTRILRQTPVKVTLVSESNDGQWQCAWEILPTFARLTVLKAAKPYWFLYEGTPGGKLDESTGFCVRSGGVKTPLSESWDEALAVPRWLYFGTEESTQVLYLIHHETAEGIDSYWPMEHNMTVFGFGRKNLQSFLTKTPARFTVGLCNQKRIDATLTAHTYSPVQLNWQAQPKEV